MLWDLSFSMKAQSQLTNDSIPKENNSIFVQNIFSIMEDSCNKTFEAISVSGLIDIANNVVSRYVFRGVIPKREKEDVVMTIVEKFVVSRSRIESAFQGKSKITTYFIAILNRMCCEVIRKESKHWYAVNEEGVNDYYHGSTLPIEAEKPFAINNEVNRLNNTLLFFNNEHTKIKLFLKCLFDLPYSHSEVVDYAGSKAQQVEVLLASIKDESKGNKFEILSEVVNFVEHKNVKGDAVRMWLNKQIDVILSRLNRNDIANHTKESLALLLEAQQN